MQVYLNQGVKPSFKTSTESYEVFGFNYKTKQSVIKNLRNQDILNYSHLYSYMNQLSKGLHAHFAFTLKNEETLIRWFKNKSHATTYSIEMKKRGPVKRAIT